VLPLTISLFAPPDGRKYVGPGERKKSTACGTGSNSGR
jgi:hypothetical protein